MFRAKPLICWSCCIWSSFSSRVEWIEKSLIKGVLEHFWQLFHQKIPIFSLIECASLVKTTDFQDGISDKRYLGPSKFSRAQQPEDSPETSMLNSKTLRLNYGENEARCPTSHGTTLIIKVHYCFSSEVLFCPPPPFIFVIFSRALFQPNME